MAFNDQSFFSGDKESGKTTLIAKLQVNDDPKKGAGLEYHYIDVRDEYRDGELCPRDDRRERWRWCPWSSNCVSCLRDNHTTRKKISSFSLLLLSRSLKTTAEVMTNEEFIEYWLIPPWGNGVFVPLKN